MNIETAHNGDERTAARATLNRGRKLFELRVCAGESVDTMNGTRNDEEFEVEHRRLTNIIESRDSRAMDVIERDIKAPAPAPATSPVMQSAPRSPRELGTSCLNFAYMALERNGVRDAERHLEDAKLKGDAQTVADAYRASDVLRNRGVAAAISVLCELTQPIATT